MIRHSSTLFASLLLAVFAESAPVERQSAKHHQQREAQFPQFPFGRHGGPFPFTTRSHGFTLSPTGAPVPTSFPTTVATTIPISIPTTLTTTDIPTTGPSIPITLTSATTVISTTSEQTIVTPAPSPSSSPAPSPSSSPAPPGNGTPLNVILQNTLDSDNVHAYITGLDSTGRVVMLTTDGEFFYPSTSGSATPQVITADVGIPLARTGNTQITLPDYIIGARVWFADGTLTFSAVETTKGVGLVQPTVANANDPDIDVNWGFVELTYSAEAGLFANLSFVDFVGIPLGMSLVQTSGATQSAPGVPPDAVTQLCQKLKDQESQDSQPWSQLCTSGADGSLLRVVSPTILIGGQSNAFADYWTNYIDQAWQKYTTEQLTINTQAAPGDVPCTSDGSTITCQGDSQTYSKPSAADIFGCNSGPFTVLQSDNEVHKAVVPRICAAIHRATLHDREGDIQPKQPPSDYYRTRTNNWYSAFVHEVEIDGRGYAFPYDDVAPSTQDDTAGIVAAPDPQLLTITIGGPS